MEGQWKRKKSRGDTGYPRCGSVATVKLGWEVMVPCHKQTVLLRFSFVFKNFYFDINWHHLGRRNLS